MAKYLFYNVHSPVKLTADGRTVVLNFGTLFKVEKIEGRWFVVTGGTRFPIKPEYVPELQRRSTAAKPSAEFKAEDTQFDKLAHRFERHALTQASRLAKDVEHDIRRGVAYAKFYQHEPFGSVLCVLAVNSSRVLAAIYDPAKTDLSAWPFRVRLWQAFDRLCLRLKQSESLKVDKPTNMRAVVANITLPWGEAFSGQILYRSANWR